MSRRKSYNPFRMWGSWIGLILASAFYKQTFCFWYCSKISAISLIKDESWLGLLFWIIIIGGAGFLLGWLVNSAWRKFK